MVQLICPFTETGVLDALLQHDPHLRLHLLLQQWTRCVCVHPSQTRKLLNVKILAPSSVLNPGFVVTLTKVSGKCYCAYAISSCFFGFDKLLWPEQWREALDMGMGAVRMETGWLKCCVCAGLSAGVTVALPADIFSQAYKPAAYTVCGFFNWISLFLIGILFPVVVVSTYWGWVFGGPIMLMVL